MDMESKKYGVTKLILNVRKKFERRLAALEDKYMAILWDFCVTKGGDFGDQNYDELLDNLGLDPSDRLKGASNAFKERHDHQIFVYKIEEYAKGSQRVQYIRLFEASWENALERIDRFQNILVFDPEIGYAGQEPASEDMNPFKD